MTQSDFIKETRSAYLEARECIYKSERNTEILSRGTSHSISSITEDLFGYYCAEKVLDKKNIKIYVDPPVSFKGTELKNKSNKKALLIRPDLMITRDNIATCFFDIKTDLGYKRKDFFNQARERNEQLSLIKGKSAATKNGNTKEKYDIVISENIKFIYIVISQGNIKKTVQDGFIKQIKSLENVDIFLLTTGDHLNSYKKEPNFEINQNHFNSLDRLLNEYLN